MCSSAMSTTSALNTGRHLFFHCVLPEASQPRLSPFCSQLERHHGRRMNSADGWVEGDCLQGSLTPKGNEAQ